MGCGVKQCYPAVMTGSTMTDTAATAGSARPADAATEPFSAGPFPDAERDLAPVIIHDSIFDNPDYSPLDVYGGAEDGGARTSPDSSPKPYPALPVVISCPHAGRGYPAGMLAAAAVPVTALRGLEDFGVDCLLPDLVAAGLTMVINRVARAYIDVNRDAAAIDPLMFSHRVKARPPCHHVRAGYGLLPKLTANRKPIYRDKLDIGEIDLRVARIHTPYHSTIASLCDAALARHGRSLLIDMHSMPAYDRLNNRLPDIICGDGHGTTIDRDMAGAISGFFQDQGLSVAWNHPYAGGYITRSNGAAGTPRQALQIEINRGVYMDGPSRLDAGRVAATRAGMGAFGRFLATQFSATE